jgi:hypothetical protein
VPEKQKGEIEVQVVFDSGPLAGMLRTKKRLNVKEK